MRVTLVLPVYWPAIGGCEIHSRALVERLAERHEVRVVCVLNRQEEKLVHPDLWTTCLLYGRRNGESDEVDGVPVHLVGLSGGLRRVLYPAIRAYRRAEGPSMALLERAFAAIIAPHIQGADVVHVVHGGVSFLGRGARRAAEREGIPFVFTSVLHLFHGWDHLLEGGATTDPWNVPYVRKMPATYHDRFWGELTIDADAVLALTEHERGMLVEEGVAAERIHVTGVGPVVDPGGPSRDEMRERHGIPESAPLALFLGRKQELKGIGEILEAAPRVWERFPDARFAFVGPTEGGIEELFREAHDRRIVEVGPVDDAEKAGWLRACDVFVNPSVHESLGGVFLEAWHFGRPVVAGDIPPVREICGGGEGGILVERRDPAQIADALVRLFADPAAAREMGRWGKEHVARRYSWSTIAERTEAAYAAAIDHAASGRHKGTNRG